MFVSQSTSLWRPASASESFIRILYFASAVSDILVINVINNIRTSIYYIFLRDMCYDILFILLYIRET